MVPNVDVSLLNRTRKTGHDGALLIRVRHHDFKNLLKIFTDQLGNVNADCM